MSLGLARARVWSLAFACTVISAAPVAAQGWNYPSFNHPQIMSREFNFALADGCQNAVARVDLRRAYDREGAVELFRLLHRHGVEDHAQPRRGAL